MLTSVYVRGSDAFRDELRHLCQEGGFGISERRWEVSVIDHPIIVYTLSTVSFHVGALSVLFECKITLKHSFHSYILGDLVVYHCTVSYAESGAAMKKYFEIGCPIDNTNKV